MTEMQTEMECLATRSVNLTDSLLKDTLDLRNFIRMLPDVRPDAAHIIIIDQHLIALRNHQFDIECLSAIAKEQAKLLDRIYAITLHAVDQLRIAASTLKMPADDNFICMEELAQIQELIAPVFPGEHTLGV